MTLASDRQAILRGMKAATKLLRDMNWSDAADGSVRVDVFDAIARSGAFLMFKPLDPLLGAYMNQDGVKGVIITTRRPIGIQRFTAAHELGHMTLNHEPHADDSNILRRGPMAGSYKSVPVEEREADAFASHFLLPRTLIHKLHSQQGWDEPDYDNPQTAYQASLRFGASYVATLLALEREALITGVLRRKLEKVQPRDLKAELVDGFDVPNWSNRDVWRLTEKDEGVVVEANRNDLFLLKLTEHKSAGYLWTFDQLADAGFVVLKDEAQALSPGRIGGTVRRYVLGDPQQLPEGSYTVKEARAWDVDDDPRSLTFHYRHSRSNEDGVYDRQVDRFLSSI